MRADVQDPQWWVGLHNLQLLGILVKEIAVSEKDVHVDVSTARNYSSPDLKPEPDCNCTSSWLTKLGGTVARGLRHDFSSCTTRFHSSAGLEVAYSSGELKERTWACKASCKAR